MRSVYWTWCALFLAPALHSAPTTERPELAILRDWASSEELWEEFKWGGGPLGGYLYRFEFDLTGDGNDELFVSSSLFAGGSSWYVFGKRSDGEYQKLGTFGLRPGAVFYVKRDPSLGTTVTTFSALDIHTAFVRQTTFDHEGSVTARNRTEITGSDRGGFPIGYDVGETVSPRLQKILLCEYVADPQASWRPYLPHASSKWQRHDPADQGSIEEIDPRCEEQLRKMLGLKHDGD